MSYVIERQVGISQTDGNGRLSLGGVLDHMIDCVVFELESLSTFGNYLRENNLGMFQVHSQVDILRRPAYGEKISIQTIIYDCSGIRGHRNTLIRDAAGRVCVAIYSTGAFVNRENGRPCKLPPEVIDSFQAPPRYDMEYLPVKIALPETADWRQAAPRLALPCHLDMNGHVNSNRYVAFAEEMLPAGFTYDRLRVEYRHQTKPGEVLISESCCVGDAAYCRIANDAGELKAVISFERMGR